MEDETNGKEEEAIRSLFESPADGVLSQKDRFGDRPTIRPTARKGD